MSMTPLQTAPLVFASVLMILTVIAIRSRERPRTRKLLVVILWAFSILVGYLPFRVVPRNMPQPDPLTVPERFSYYEAWQAGRVAVWDSMVGYETLLLVVFTCFALLAFVGGRK